MRFFIVVFCAACVLGCSSSEGDSGKSASGGAGGAPGPWRTEAPLPEAVADLSGTESGGKIWVAGGVAGGAAGGVSKKVYSYDPATAAWTAGPDLPLPRQLAAMSSVGGDLYAVGGFSDVDASPTDSTYVLEAGGSAWKKVASLLLNRAAAFAADIDGTLHVVAGRGDSNLLADTVVFDAAANSWAVKAPIPNPRLRFAGFVLSGWIYAAGGATESGGVTNKVDVYEPKGNVWTNVAEFPAPRDGLGAAVVGGKAYVVGGDATGTTDVYDGSAWSSGPPLSTPRIGAAVVAAQGRVYVIGGTPAGGGDPTNVVESYAP